MFGKNKSKDISPKVTEGFSYETVLISGEKTTDNIYDEINEQIGKRPGLKLAHVLPIARPESADFSGNTSSIILIFEREV